MADTRKRNIPARSTERRFLKLAGEATRNDCPNPERIGCPNSDAIQTIVSRRFSSPDFENLVDHIATCAPCYEDYARRRRLRSLRRASAAAVLCATVLILGLVWRRSMPNVPQRDAPVAKETPREILAATLDYSRWSPERSDRPQSHPPASPRIARGRLDLTIKLPIGTEDGDYTVAFLSNGGPVAPQAVGHASWDGTAEVLKIKTDLTTLQPGAYTVAVQSGDSFRRLYPVILE